MLLTMLLRPRRMNPSIERKLALETTVLEEKYTLPDGRVIRLGKERFEAPEALFKPSLIDCDQPGVGDMLFDMIQVCVCVCVFVFMYVCVRVCVFVCACVHVCCADPRRRSASVSCARAGPFARLRNTLVCRACSHTRVRAAAAGG
jgi:hypothetical protein